MYRDSPVYSFSFVLLFVITRPLSLGHVVPATLIQPIQNAFFLMIVIKEIKGHLRSHDVRDSSLRTESRLPLARADQFIIFYLTYTFDPISIKFFQPFLDDTSTTQAVLRPKKSQERWANFPRGGPGMVELCNVLNIKEYSEN